MAGDLFAECRHTGAQVDGGGGFANAALLVCYCDDFCHAVPPLFLRFLAALGPLASIIAQTEGIKKGVFQQKSPADVPRGTSAGGYAMPQTARA